MIARVRARAGAAVVLAALLALARAPVAAGQNAAAGTIDYASVFGDKYAEAEQFLKTNAWISGLLGFEGDEARAALAVVFPEIIRFRALEDMIQVRALKVLYVQYGRKYADFSIGHFQMKPTFAEQVEHDSNRHLSAKERAAAGAPVFVEGDSVAIRRDRILRLDDMKWQARYLGLFMRIMDKRFAAVDFADARDRVRFYATAYNVGYTRSAAAIRRLMTVASFHTERLFAAAKYRYADVAVFFFDRR